MERSKPISKVAMDALSRGMNELVDHAADNMTTEEVRTARKEINDGIDRVRESELLSFLRQIRDLSKWDGPDAAPSRMHEIWQKVSTAIANIEWEISTVQANRQPRTPWNDKVLSEWSIVGMNHYFISGKRQLFVAMMKDGRCIQEEGDDDEYLWNRLWHKATRGGR